MDATTAPAPANAEAVEAWDGPLFDRFVQYRHLIVAGLKSFGDEALRRYPPRLGSRVLDIGCGFGDTTQQIAAVIGPGGVAVGVDAAPRFIDAARAEAEASGCPNAMFIVADVERTTFEGVYDMAFSRMGTMFFANPVAALRNVRAALAPGGLLVMVVWRSKVENEWVWRTQQITERFVTKPETYDEPTCGPGPFAMGNADTVTGQLVAAGYGDITLHRLDMPMLLGRDVDEAADLAMALGPAGEILRLSGDRAAHLHEPVHAALAEGLADWDGPDGVQGPASTWIVSARAPG
jgi:SAM-dependent methyltransferase